MNSLSWFLYIAEVSENAKEIFGFIAIMGFMATGFYTAFFAIERHEIAPHLKKILALLFAFMLVSILIPKSRTIYMIAASEAGQQIAQTDDGKEMIELVKSKIKESLKSEK